jgi:hypothetical protein
VALREHPISELAVQHTTTVAVTNNGAKFFAWGQLEVCGKGVIRMSDRTTPVEFEVPGGLGEDEIIVSSAAGRYVCIHQLSQHDRMCLVVIHMRLGIH